MLKSWLLKRFREPSTWAGLAGILASAGVVTQVQALALGEIVRVIAENWAAVASLAAGTVAVVAAEKGNAATGQG